MRTARALAWLTVGILNVAFGGLVMTWADWPAGGGLIAIIGLLISLDSITILIVKGTSGQNI